MYTIVVAVLAVVVAVVVCVAVWDRQKRRERKEGMSILVC